ncbi:Platinum sensitivity protein [Apophysomyces sp. BC1034]|nr:Platinum sensitivity protein [Apophysomyces sp. BC1015]KAG0173563.1 Platinum sensitivity protein [Apophysomyces sp. BC1021]KAG0185538.1 Platinum sensitivity protein [Apophysomyces sp. BC1034]
MTEDSATRTSADQSSPPSKRYRVKLYELNPDSNWEDKGTGNCIYVTGTGEELDEIRVRSENDNSILLSSTVVRRRVYQRQQDTLIVWTEDDNQDLALSFQEIEGCEEIWHFYLRRCICAAKVIKQSTDDEDESHNEENIKTNSSTLDEADGNATPKYDSKATLEDDRQIPLDPPSLSNLAELAKILTSAKTAYQKVRLAEFILTDNYIEKLLPIFESCEDLENLEDLHHLYTIMKAIILLNENAVIEHIIRDDMISPVMGMLEYDPRTPKMKANHRKIIARCAEVQSIVPIKDEQTMSKIHQTFRLQYLKDVVLVNSLDETLTSTLHSLIFFNHLDIVNFISNDEDFLSDLFAVLKNSESEEKKKETIRFLHQFFSIAKSLQPSSRAGLFRTLAPFGFLDSFLISLTDSEKTMRAEAVDLLSSVVEHDASLVRSYMLRESKDEKNGAKLLETIVEQFTMDRDHNLKFQYAEIIRVLLDSNNGATPGTMLTGETLRKQEPDMDLFLTLFYDKYTTLLLRPLQEVEVQPLKLTGPIEELNIGHNQSELCVHICELLCFAIRQHGFRSKYLMLSTDCFVKVAQLLRCRETYVKLAALRLFRTCISLTDDFYNRHLVKHNIFEPTIRVVLDTDGRDNLLNSACLELLEFIRKENIKILVNHLITQFGSVLDTITYVRSCKHLRLRHEQNIEPLDSESPATDKASTSSKPPKGTMQGAWTSSTVDQDEEDYFNGSDEEESDMTKPIDTSKISAALSAPLVDYEDEDEESETAATNKENEHDKSVGSESTKGMDGSSNEPRTNASGDAKSLPKQPEETGSDPNEGSSTTTLTASNKTTIPGSPKRKLEIDEDDEDDVLAARVQKKSDHRQTPLNSPKTIIINSRITSLRARKRQE